MAGWKSKVACLGAGELQADELEIGSIAGVFGVRGEVRLHLHNRESVLLHTRREVVMIAEGVRYRISVKARSGAGRRILGTIEGLEDRDEAEALLGAVLVIPRTKLPEPGPGEYYLDEVVGMEVLCAGLVVGTVEAVHATGPVEVLELNGGRYLPSTAENLVAIDREKRLITVSEGAIAD